MPRPSEYKINQNKFEQVANELLAECEREKRTPFLHEFAYKLGIAEETLTDYSKRPAYQATVRKVRTAGKTALVKAIDTSKQANIGKIFLAKSVYGLIEKQQFEITGEHPQLGLPKRRK